MNECGNNNGDCSHTCINVDGSFMCSCRNGYELECDQKPCKDMREWGTWLSLYLVYIHSATIPCGENDCTQDCSAATGDPICSCINGYELGDDRKTCNGK